MPVHNYSQMREKWWYRCLNGEADVTWPGKVKYFALSSGTSDAASKHIPVTRDMIRATRKVGMAQLRSLPAFDIPAVTFQKGVLMLGGTTSMQETNGYFEGDMSGISTANMPAIFSGLYFKPGQNIAKEPEWQKRIENIVQNAHRWDIGMVCGIPSWVQIVFEKIIGHYGLNTIHDLWPNLNVYIHGGVSFDNYRDSFKNLLGKPITYLETYMASEGSFGFKCRSGDHGIKLVLNAGIFFEFIPFDELNFDENGHVRPGARTITIEDVDEHTNYALVISTCAGAWRYLIGDVIKFTDVSVMEIAIVGRTSQFLNLCGEHVSIENITAALDTAAKQLNISVGEFSVAGVSYKSRFAYRWFIGSDDPVANVQGIAYLLDQALYMANDDYKVERQAGAISHVFVEVLPKKVFRDFLLWTKKDDAMSKFPRVMKGAVLQDWEQFLLENSHPNKKNDLVLD